MKKSIIKGLTHFIRDKNKRKQVRNILLYGDVVDRRNTYFLQRERESNF